MNLQIKNFQTIMVNNLWTNAENLHILRNEILRKMLIFQAEKTLNRKISK